MSNIRTSEAKAEEDLQKQKIYEYFNVNGYH